MQIVGRGATTSEAWQDAMSLYDQYVSAEIESWIALTDWEVDPGYERTPVSCRLTVAVSTPALPYRGKVVT